MPAPNVGRQGPIGPRGPSGAGGATGATGAAGPGVTGIYHLIAQTHANVADTNTAATYFVAAGNGSLTADAAAVNGAVFGVLHLVAADYDVAGLSEFLSLRAIAIVNATAPAITITAGLYPASAGVGGADVSGVDLGTVVAGSTAAIASPAALSVGTATSGDFALPADGVYVLGLALSGTPAADSRVSLTIRLRVRST
jgi:hypothetical protein